VAYNVTGVTAHLKLSGKVLSAIYQGNITKWNDSQIESANPGVTLPNLPIVTLHRSDSSGDTFLFTTYLSKADPSGWGAKIGYNTTVPWPNAPGALGESGNSGMVSGCKATPGCVAYIGISYQTQVLQAGLGYAALGNSKGQYVLPSETSIAAEAAGFVKKTPANGTISLIYGPISGGYPIINYEYAIVTANQSSSSDAKNIRSVLEWAISPKYGSASTYLSQVDFQPLPTKVEAQSLKQILAIK
jgi:phosphate transport system substrate-binding protein